MEQRRGCWLPAISLLRVRLSHSLRYFGLRPGCYLDSGPGMLRGCLAGSGPGRFCGRGSRLPSLILAARILSSGLLIRAEIAVVASRRDGIVAPGRLLLFPPR